MSRADRSAPENGIWLCQNCAKIVDNDPVAYSTQTLRHWKEQAEYEARSRIGKAQLEGGTAIADKWVGHDYPERAGISARLKQEGFKLSWVAANKEVARVEFEGWEYVTVHQPDGSTARLKIRDHPVLGGYLVLLRKRESE